MTHKPSGSFYWVLIMLAAVLVMLFDAVSLPVNLRETPLLLGGTAVVLFLLLLAGEFYPPVIGWMDTTLEDLWDGNRAGSVAPDAPASVIPWPPVFRIMAYIVGFWLLVFLFGLFVVPPFFIVLFLSVEAGVRFRTAIASSAIACLLLVVGLTLLNVDLWPGVIPELVPDVIGGAVLPSL